MQTLQHGWRWRTSSYEFVGHPIKVPAVDLRSGARLDCSEAENLSNLLSNVVGDMFLQVYSIVLCKLMMLCRRSVVLYQECVVSGMKLCTYWIGWQQQEQANDASQICPFTCQQTDRSLHVAAGVHWCGTRSCPFKLCRRPVGSPLVCWLAGLLPGAAPCSPV